MTQISVCQSQLKLHGVHSPPPFRRGKGLSLQPNFRKGGLGRTSTFRGGCWERAGDFFLGEVQLSHEKSKSEIFHDKKNL